MANYYITEAGLRSLRRRIPCTATTTSEIHTPAEVLPFKSKAARRRYPIGPWLQLEWGDLTKLANGKRLRSTINTLQVRKDRKIRSPRVRRALRRALTSSPV